MISYKILVAESGILKSGMSYLSPEATLGVAPDPSRSGGRLASARIHPVELNYTYPMNKCSLICKLNLLWNHNT